MKALKIIVVSLVGLLVLLLVAVVVLSFPAVQRGIALSMLGEEGREVEIDYLRVRSGGIVAREVTVREHGERYEIEGLEARISLWDALFRREVRVDRLEIANFVADLTRSTREPDETEPFDGILGGLDFPFLVWVDEVAIAGEVYFPGMTEESPLHAEFTVSGGGIAPGESGLLRIAALATDSGRILFADPIDLSASLELGQGSSGGFNRVALAGDLVSGSGEEFAGQAMSFAIAVTGSGDGSENYEVEFYSGSGSETDRQRLIGLDGVFNHETRRLSGHWAVNLAADQLTGIIAEERLPDFAGEGEGRFRYEIDTGFLEASGRLEGLVHDPEVLAAELAGVGPVGLVARFDFGLGEDAVRLDELELEAGADGERPFLTVSTVEPVRYNFQEGGLFGNGERKQLLVVRLSGLPVGWASALGGMAEEGWSIASGTLSGELGVGVEGGRYFVDTPESLSLHGLTLVQAGEEVLRGIDARISGSFSIRHDGEGVRGRLDPFSVSANGLELLTGSATYSDASREAEAVVEVNVAGLADQPMFHAIHAMRAGKLHARGTYHWGVGRQISGDLRFVDGIGLMDEGEVQLPELAAGFEIEEIGEHRWRVDIPVEVERAGKKSDLTLTGEVAQTSAIDLDLRLAGRAVRLEDFLFFADMMGETPDGPDERDEVPLWAGVTGRFDLQVAEMVLPGGQQVSDLQGEALIVDDSIGIRATARALESPVTISGDLRFDSVEERPYRMSGMADAERLDVGEIFREAESARPPAVEGLFQLSAAMEADGRNLPDLVERIRGEFSLESGGGSYRMLGSDSPVGDLGIALGGILGSRGGDIGRGIANLMESLSHIRYDHLSLRVVRDDTFNILLQDLIVQAPELRLRGEGMVRHREGVPLLQQPMDIEVDLAARGGVQRLLHSLGALRAEAEEDDYRRLREPFRIGGTLARPDASDLYRRIGRGALNMLAPAGAEEGEERVSPLELLEDLLRRSRR